MARANRSDVPYHSPAGHVSITAIRQRVAGLEEVRDDTPHSAHE